MKRSRLRLIPPALPGLLALLAQPLVLGAAPSLVVVEDAGGVSAQPYYQALGLQAHKADAPLPRSEPPTRGLRFAEADLLPVRSVLLAPGVVTPRVIRASGLTPVFLVGDDTRSRVWLRRRAIELRGLNAVGLVVQVETAQALAALRGLAPGLTLAPVSGDELAQRLGVRHYPVLITATSIEQ